MSFTREIAATAVVFLALFACERWLSSSRTTAHEAGVKLGRLVRKEERELAPVAAVEVQLGAERWRYVDHNGIWRASYKNAVASAEKLRSLIGKVHETEGMIQGEAGSPRPDLGLGDAPAARISFLGSRFEVLYAFELGTGPREGERSFLRRVSDGNVWDVDVDLWPELERPPTGLPPLLHAFTSPYFWPGEGSRIQEIRVESTGGGTYALRMHDLPITPDEMRQGKPSFEWLLLAGSDDPVSTARELSSSYVTFLMRTPYRDVLDDSERARLSFDPPRARVTIECSSGERAVFSLSRELATGGPALLASASDSCFKIAPEIASVLFPEAEQLLPPTTDNPWSDYLRQ